MLAQQYGVNLTTLLDNCMSVRTHMYSSCAVLSLEVLEWQMIVVILAALFNPYHLCITSKKKM